MTERTDVRFLENEVFLCTISNSTRRSLEFLMKKVSQLDISPTDTVALEKLNLMKAHLEGLLDKIEPKDNYQVNWSFNWVGVIIGLIAVCAYFVLVAVLN